MDVSQIEMLTLVNLAFFILNGLMFIRKSSDIKLQKDVKALLDMALCQKGANDTAHSIFKEIQDTFVKFKKKIEEISSNHLKLLNRVRHLDKLVKRMQEGQAKD